VPRVDLELIGLVPTTGATVTAPEGSMTVRAGALGAGAAVRLGDPAVGLFAAAGAGLGALLTAFDGQAMAPWKGAGGLRASLFPYAHVAGGYWIGPQLALRADVMAGFALPEPVLSIAGKRVGFFAEPAVSLAASIEVRP
jgi:apolipoprotein N-acyltransferase